MLSLILIAFSCAFAHETLGQEHALQQLRDGSFDVILDVRSIADFEALHLEDAFHFGSLMHPPRGGHGHHGHHGGRRDSSSSSSSEDMERPGFLREPHGEEHREGTYHFEEETGHPVGERPPLDAHIERLHGCEDSRIAVVSMEPVEHSADTFSTDEVAKRLFEMGYSSVFDLGDVSSARDDGEITTASGRREGRCRPDCVIRDGPHHGRGHHHGDHGHRGPGDEQSAEAFGMDAESFGMEHQHGEREYEGRHEHRGRGDEKHDSNESADVAGLQYIWAFIGLGILVAAGLCWFVCATYCKKQPHAQIVVNDVEQQVEGSGLGSNLGEGSNIGEGSEPKCTVFVSGQTTNASPVEGSPEGFPDTGEDLAPPPSFAEVTAYENFDKYKALAE